MGNRSNNKKVTYDLSTGRHRVAQVAFVVRDMINGRRLLLSVFAVEFPSFLSRQRPRKWRAFRKAIDSAGFPPPVVMGTDAVAAVAFTVRSIVDVPLQNFNRPIITSRTRCTEMVAAISVGHYESS
jgi:hypothetical protein